MGISPVSARAAAYSYPVHGPSWRKAASYGELVAGGPAASGKRRAGPAFLAGVGAGFVRGWLSLRGCGVLGPGGTAAMPLRRLRLARRAAASFSGERFGHDLAESGSGGFPSQILTL